MAISSQINIDVDSAEFLALKTAFDKYETAGAGRLLIDK